MAHVLISYSLADLTYAHRLSDELRHRGFEVWFASRPGEDYGADPRPIHDGVDACTALVLLMSPASGRSAWVQYELELALERGKPILPILLTPPSWAMLERIPTLDATDGKLPPGSFYAALGRAVRGHANPFAGPSSPSVCAHCGRTNRDRAAYCRHCGRRLLGQLHVAQGTAIGSDVYGPVIVGPPPAPASPIGPVPDYPPHQDYVPQPDYPPHQDYVPRQDYQQPGYGPPPAQQPDVPRGVPPAPPKGPSQPPPQQPDETTGYMGGRSAEPEPVQVSAHYPQEVAPLDRHLFLAYIYRQSAAAEVRRDARGELQRRGLTGFYDRAVGQQLAQIAPGALVSATPELDGFEFYPASQAIYFREDWHRLDFELRAVQAPLERDASGRIWFAVEGVVVADVQFTVFVSQTASTPRQASAVANPYTRIFCSYSHRDTQIARRVQTVCEMMGYTFFRDEDSLRSGEAWDARLLEAIAEAELFQLFWSQPASESEYVRQEWQYALSLPHKPPRFIQPYFWQQPMAPPPGELSHLHFRYEPRLAE